MGPLETSFHGCSWALHGTFGPRGEIGAPEAGPQIDLLTFESDPSWPG